MNRYIMKKGFKWMVVLLAVASFAFAAERKPNILLIVSDDQGYGDFGFTGNPVVQTPAIDRLSKESAFFCNYNR